jgi:hypothetical protein
MRIKIKNWHKFQHFKDRKPPWIKLYRDLLDEPRWFKLSGESAKTLIMFWLLASESDGYLPDIKTISFRLRIDEKKSKSLIDNLKEWLDITMISDGYQDDAPETETETKIEIEGETDNDSPSWKTDFSIYLKECTDAFKLISSDDTTIQEQSKFYPDVDIAKSIEKSFINFWSTEAGWKHKKKSRSKDIDWRMTFINAIGLNKVYMPRQFANRTPVVPASAPKTLTMYELKEKRDALMKRREAIYKQEDMAERAELTKKVNEVNGLIARYGE